MSTTSSHINTSADRVDSGPPCPPELAQKPFRFYFKQHKRIFIVGIICLLFTNILDALPPYLIGMAIDQITHQAGMSEIGRTVVLILVVTVFLSLFRYLWRIFWGRFHHSVAEDLRNRIFTKLTQLGPSYYQKHPIGQLMSLITNDVNSFRMAVGPGVLIFLDALFLLMILPPLMLSLSPSWTWKTLILMPLIPILIFKIERLLNKRWRQQQDKFAEMSGAAQEIVSGIRVIKSYAQEKNQTRLFNIFSRNYEIACNQVAKTDAVFSPTLEMGVTIGGVILILVGTPEVLRGEVTVGAFFAFYQYIQRMIWPMTAVGVSLSFIQQGKASFERILNLLSSPIDIPDNGEIELKAFSTLEVRNLSFTYPGETQPSLKNISFSLKTGETLGIIGITGSGKSTLIDLLCRHYPVPPQTIFINDYPIENIRKSSLRQLFSVVPQDAFLFSRKISENIALGVHSWELKEVQQAAALVNLDKEIEDTPMAYEAYLGERGVNLSGGQKQRLTMARALVRNSPVVILDDSLSAVDARTESYILACLKGQLGTQANQQPITAIIVSHRLASIRLAEKVLVLNAGEMEAFGSHSELHSNSPTYRQLDALQNSEPENLAGGQV